MTDLQSLVASFNGARRWERFHTPKNLSMAIAIEAAELLEIFQWLTPEQAQSVQVDSVANELADIMIYCLSMGNAFGIDTDMAILEKIRRNKRRYPIEQFKDLDCWPEKERE